MQNLYRRTWSFTFLWLGDVSTDSDRPFLPFLDSILNLTPVVDTPFIRRCLLTLHLLISLCVFLVLCIFAHLCLLTSLIPVVFPLYDVVSMCYVSSVHWIQGTIVLQSVFCHLPIHDLAPLEILYAELSTTNIMQPAPSKLGQCIRPQQSLITGLEIKQGSSFCHPSFVRTLTKQKSCQRTNTPLSFLSDRTKTRRPKTQTPEPKPHQLLNPPPCHSHSNRSPSTCVPSHWSGLSSGAFSEY
jgi:hypothetical protein